MGDHYCQWAAVGDPQCWNVTEDDDLCEEHRLQQMDEEAADNDRKQQKENSTWTN